MEGAERERTNGMGTQRRRPSSSSGTGGARWTGSGRWRPPRRPSARALRRPAHRASAPDATAGGCDRGEEMVTEPLILRRRSPASSCLRRSRCSSPSSGGAPLLFSLLAMARVECGGDLVGRPSCGASAVGVLPPPLAAAHAKRVVTDRDSRALIYISLEFRLESRLSR